MTDFDPLRSSYRVVGMRRMRRAFRIIVMLAGGFLSGCNASPSANEPTLRACMENEARQVARESHRRLTFDEARNAGLKCVGTKALRADEDSVDDLACAYSEDWGRCDLPPPID